MQQKRLISRTAMASNITKASKKYVPTPQQATIIINYFLHNNFQDFNTWQQISKSRCEFEYNQTKAQGYQCKITLKWDDVAMPVIVQIGVSRNKKNSKKKALYKLIQNLIFLGLIGYGFKDTQFIKKLPKRRKQQSDQQSQISVQINDEKMSQLIKYSQYEQALILLNYKNFIKILTIAIKQQNLILFTKIIKKLQNKQNYQEIDISYRNQDIQDNCIMNYKQIIIQDPLQKDLTQVLKLCTIPSTKTGVIKKDVKKDEAIKPRNMQLPCLTLNSAQGKISFQFFHPIEYSLIFRRNLQQQLNVKPKNQKSSYFSDFYKEIPLPKFQHEEFVIPLPCKVIQKILNLILEFSYNYRLIVNLMSILQRQVNNCNLQLINDDESQKFYLKHMNTVTVQFAYLLNKKSQIISSSIQGLINIESDGFLTFTPKQPEQVFVQKINRKINTSQIQQMQEFANQEYVLLVSKLDSKVFYIGQIIQCWPSIRLKSLSFDKDGDKQKLPFTMYKLANAKLYNRLTKSVTQVAKTKISNLYSNTFVIVQNPTQPLLSIICELLSEWVSLTQTILIVSQNFNQIYAYLIQKGFKVAKINQKLDEKNIIKKQIVCCNPASVCADVIKNYAFTRVIIEAAQRVSQLMSTLPLNKGYRKIYLIGDQKLPSSLSLTKYGINRNMTKSLFQNMLASGAQFYNFKSNIEQSFFDTSILSILNKFFYKQQLNKFCVFDSPLIKGFPWPSQIQRIAFIQISDQNNKSELEQQVQTCCQIIAQVIKSGFIGLNEIACRVTSASARALLTSTLYNMFKKQQELGINAELGSKIIDFITGSRFKQRSLCILIGETQQMEISHLIAGMQEGRRGFIIMSNFRKLQKQKIEWQQIIKYANQRKLFLQKIK